MCLGIDVRGLLYSPVPESSWSSAKQEELDTLKSLECGARFSRIPTVEVCPTWVSDAPQAFIQWSLQKHTEIPKTNSINFFL